MALMPAAGIDVTHGLVRRLLEEQRPDLATLPLTRIANGWDNVIFRLGPSYAVRLPRRSEAVELIVKEQAYLPGYERRSPVPIPGLVFSGRPSRDYPWPWSIVRWLEGEQASVLPAPFRARSAEALAAFLKGIQVPAPGNAPVNPFRGVPLSQRNDDVLQRLEDGRRYGQARQLRRLWSQALAMRPWSQAPVWIHGDLHAANILIDNEGALAGVIDFGDLGAGDPAVDLAAAWLVFDAEGRRRFVLAMGADVDAETWERARGWALVLASAMVSNSDDSSMMLACGHFALDQVLGTD